MTNEETPAEPVAAEATTEAAPVPPAPAVAPEAPRQRLRDHLFTFRSVIAVGVATLLLGGAGGAAVVALADDGGDGPRMVRFDGPGRGGDFGGGPGYGGREPR